MTHEHAVFIARSGEGAIVAELTRLSAEVEHWRQQSREWESSVDRFLDNYSAIEKMHDTQEVK